MEQKLKNFIDFCEKQEMNEKLKDVFVNLKNATPWQFMGIIKKQFLDEWEKAEADSKYDAIRKVLEQNAQFYAKCSFEECADEEVRLKFVKYMDYFCKITKKVRANMIRKIEGEFQKAGITKEQLEKLGTVLKDSDVKYDTE